MHQFELEENQPAQRAKLEDATSKNDISQDDSNTQTRVQDSTMLPSAASEAVSENAESKSSRLSSVRRVSPSKLSFGRAKQTSVETPTEPSAEAKPKPTASHLANSGAIASSFASVSAMAGSAAASANRFMKSFSRVHAENAPSSKQETSPESDKSTSSLSYNYGKGGYSQVLSSPAEKQERFAGKMFGEDMNEQDRRVSSSSKPIE
jgi:hypothetical protein